jgi:hypothetical protein
MLVMLAHQQLRVLEGNTLHRDKFGRLDIRTVGMTPHYGQRVWACSSHTMEPQRGQIGGESIMPYNPPMTTQR